VLVATLLGLGCASVSAPTQSGAAGTGGSVGSVGTAGGGGTAGVISIGGGPQINTGGSGGAGPCTGLACAIDPCTGQPTKTTVKGTVYDPAGQVPLYNVMVYVPNAPLDAIAEGASCQKCDAVASGRPVASALSDATGAFTMTDVPVGPNIPVVVQTGKWRRQVTLPEVKACQENVFSTKETFRLPRSQAEGNLPKIAMSRGKADSLECLMRRIGVADSEFTNPDGPGRVNIFYETGDSRVYDSGAQFPPVSDLMASLDSMRRYDMVVMSCHGVSDMARAQPTAQKQVVKSYVDIGGRLFGSHFYFSWLRGATMAEQKQFQVSPFPPIVTWDGEGGDGVYSVETGIPKGVAYASWLVAVGATTTNGQITLHSVESPAMSLMPGLAQQWIHRTNSIPYFSVPTPVEMAATPDAQCGRLVHTGIHISGGGESEGPFPSSCETGALSGQEKALEFLLFDLSACIIPYTSMPRPPITNPDG
jgi:hypothetical protein